MSKDLGGRREYNGMETASSYYLTAKDICRICGVARAKAYRLIRQMNEELREGDKITIAGKVPRKYFEERMCIYG